MRIPLISRIMENRRLNDEILVLHALRDFEWHRIMQIHSSLKMNSFGRLHVALMRLQNKGLVESEYEDQQGILPIRVYCLTPKGMELLVVGEHNQRMDDERNA